MNFQTKSVNGSREIQFLPHFVQALVADILGQGRTQVQRATGLRPDGPSRFGRSQVFSPLVTIIRSKVSRNKPYILVVHKFATQPINA